MFLCWRRSVRPWNRGEVIILIEIEGQPSKPDVLHGAAAFLVPGLDGNPTARVLRRTQERGVKTCLNTAWDPEGRWMELLEPCLPPLDYFIPSLQEARMLSGEKAVADMAAVFLDRGGDTIVIKVVDKGCYATNGEQEFFKETYEVETVTSTLGAGDAFAAGFLAGIVRGRKLDGACQMGNAAGASCVEGTGCESIRPLEETLQRYRLDG